MASSWDDWDDWDAWSLPSVTPVKEDAKAGTTSTAPLAVAVDVDVKVDDGLNSDTLLSSIARLCRDGESSLPSSPLKSIFEIEAEYHKQEQALLETEVPDLKRVTLEWHRRLPEESRGKISTTLLQAAIQQSDGTHVTRFDPYCSPLMPALRPYRGVGLPWLLCLKAVMPAQQADEAPAYQLEAHIRSLKKQFGSFELVDTSHRRLPASVWWLVQHYQLPNAWLVSSRVLETLQPTVVDFTGVELAEWMVEYVRDSVRLRSLRLSLIGCSKAKTLRTTTGNTMGMLREIVKVMPRTCVRLEIRGTILSYLTTLQLCQIVGLRPTTAFVILKPSQLVLVSGDIGRIRLPNNVFVET